MREQTEKTVFTFACTTDALIASKFCKERGLEGRLAPVPRSVSSSCGQCWMVEKEYGEKIREAFAEENIATEGVYSIRRL